MLDKTDMGAMKSNLNNLRWMTPPKNLSSFASLNHRLQQVYKELGKSVHYNYAMVFMFSSSYIFICFGAKFKVFEILHFLKVSP